MPRERALSRELESTAIRFESDPRHQDKPASPVGRPPEGRLGPIFLPCRFCRPAFLEPAAVATANTAATVGIDLSAAP